MAPLTTTHRVWTARAIALAVDIVQWGLLPASLTPLNGAIDVATGLAMVALVGWHWAFLPTFAAELVPFVDLVPTWTLAVTFATRGRVAEEAVPPPADQAPRDGSGS